MSRQLNEFSQMDPDMDAANAAAGAEPAGPEGAMIHADPEADVDTLPDQHDSLEIPAGEKEQQGKMAKADLYKLASYSHKLFNQLNDDDELESWVEAKITKAADYITSVFHYLAYEMKVSEYGHHLDNAETLSEGQRAQLKAMLSEAKEKVKELKKSQAEKMSGKTKEKKVEESRVEDHHADLVHAAAIVAGLKRRKSMPKVKPASAMTSDMSPLSSVPVDDECMDMGMEEMPAQPRQVHPKVKAKLEKYGKETEAMAAAARRINKKADMEEDMTEGKAKCSCEDSGKAKCPVHGKMSEGKKAKPDFLDMDGDGNKKEPMKKAIKDKAMKEAAPSAGLSKAKKSATVKKAKAGGDIGKPGKGFKKVADKAAKKYGSKEAGEKVAAAAMWKNIKETTAYMMEKSKSTKKPEWLEKAEVEAEVKSGAKVSDAEKKKVGVKESTDFSRMQEQMARLNRSETSVLKESSEADQIRALTKRLLG